MAKAKNTKTKGKPPAAKPKQTARKTGAKKPAATAAELKPRTVTAYLAVNDAAGAIDWYKKVFGAKESAKREMMGPKVMHATLRIGDSDFHLSDIFPGSDLSDPTRSGASVSMQVYNKNVDKLWQNALANGAKVTMPIDNMFWGDRYGKFVDPFGHSWALIYKAKMSKAEIAAKTAEAMKMMGAPPT